MQKTSLGQQGVKAENFHERHKGYIILFMKKCLKILKEILGKLRC